MAKRLEGFMKNIVTLENGVKMDMVGDRIVVSSNSVEIILDGDGNLVSIISNMDDVVYDAEEVKDSKVVENKKVVLHGNLEGQISDMLYMLGIPASLGGYDCLKTAILLVYNDPSYIHTVVSRLYPDVGKIHCKTASSAERCIRHAIEVSWDRADAKFRYEIFKWSTSPKRGKATNTEFIATLADYLRRKNS